MAVLSDHARLAYRSFVYDDAPRGVPTAHYFGQATPIDAISRLNIGSRPRRRRKRRAAAPSRSPSCARSRGCSPGRRAAPGCPAGTGWAAGWRAMRGRSRGCGRSLRRCTGTGRSSATLIDNAQLSMRQADMGIAEIYSTLADEDVRPPCGPGSKRNSAAPSGASCGSPARPTCSKTSRGCGAPSSSATPTSTR